MPVILQAGDAMVAEIARMNGGQRSGKAASAYLNHLIGEPPSAVYTVIVESMPSTCTPKVDRRHHAQGHL